MYTDWSYDTTDCTQDGYETRLYADGHLEVEYQTRWQGSRTGSTWSSGPSGERAAEHAAGDVRDGHVWDAVTCLIDSLSEAHVPEGWRHTNRGHFIQ